jgi:hypothetical protein
MDTKQRVHNLAFLADCERIHREWHERAKARDTNGLLALVQAIFDGRPSAARLPQRRGGFHDGPARNRSADALYGDDAVLETPSESDCLFGSIRAPRRTGIKSTSLRSWRLPMAAFSIIEFIGAGSEPPC